MENYLGYTATDRITGISGICTGYVKYITGCNQYLVQPKSTDNSKVESWWFDEGRLVFSKKPVFKFGELHVSKNPGSCESAPKL